MKTKKRRTYVFRYLKRLKVHLLTLLITASICSSQDMQNSGTIVNTAGQGVIKIQGSLTTSQTSYIGTVEFYGGAQNIPAISYDTLKTSGSGVKTLNAGKTVVKGTVNLTGGTLTVAASDTLELQKSGSAPVKTTGGSFDAAAGTVNYTSAGQVIYGTTYKNLYCSGNGGKTTSGAVTVTGMVTTAAAGDSVNFGPNAFVGTGSAIANNGVLLSQGSVTLGSGTVVNGTFVYNAANGSQTVADATYLNTLSLSGGAAKTIGTLVIGDVYSATGGARNYGTGRVTYNKAGAQSIAGENYYNLTLGGSGTKTVAGTTVIGSSLVDSVNTVIASGTTSLSSGATAAFYNNLTATGTFDASALNTSVVFGGDAQSITGASMSFYNLTLSGTAAKTSSANISVAGAFTPTRGINMGSTATLAIMNASAGAIGTYGSNEEVIGNLQRAVTTSGTYKLNNDSTSIAFSAGSPSTFTMRVDSSSNPFSYNPTFNVNRKVTVSYAGWTTGQATLKLAYKYSERTNLTNESNLLLYKSDGTSTSNKMGATYTSRTAATSSGFGSLTLTGILPTSASDYTSSAYLPSGAQIIMSSLANIIMAIQTGTWNSASTWQGGIIPGANDAVEIPSPYTVTTTPASIASSIVVDASGGLTLSNGLTVNSSLTNSGTIVIPSGQTLQVAALGSGRLQNNVGGVVNNGGLIQVGN